MCCWHNFLPRQTEGGPNCSSITPSIAMHGIKKNERKKKRHTKQFFTWVLILLVKINVWKLGKKQDSECCHDVLCSLYPWSHNNMVDRALEISSLVDRALEISSLVDRELEISSLVDRALEIRNQFSGWQGIRNQFSGWQRIINQFSGWQGIRNQFSCWQGIRN